MRTIQALRDWPDQTREALLGEAFAFFQHLRQRKAVLEIHHHVGGAMDLEQAADTNDIGMPGRLRQIPEQLRLFDELLQAERVDLFRIRIGGNNRVAIAPLADGAWKIFLDGNQLVKINAAPLVDDAESADAEHLLEPPF